MANFNKSIKTAYKTFFTTFFSLYARIKVAISFTDSRPFCFIKTIYTAIFICSDKFSSILYNKRLPAYLTCKFSNGGWRCFTPLFPQAIALGFSSAFKRTKFSTIFSCPSNFKFSLTYNTSFYYPRMPSFLFNFHEEIISFFRLQVKEYSLPLAHIYLEKE